jgi:ASC-1-like (ASCH) protein
MFSEREMVVATCVGTAPMINCSRTCFDRLKDGTQTVECWPAVEGLLMQRPGSILSVGCHRSPKRVHFVVTRAAHYDSIRAFLEKEGLVRALPSARTLEEGIEEYRRRCDYDADIILSNGVVALNLARICV